jgi:uncharacterized protein YigE (DUF2233 family)
MNMIRLFATLFLLLATCPLFAQIRYDTVAQKVVGPGCVWTKVIAPDIPWNINILKVNLKDPYIKLETVIANEKLISGKEKTTSMSARRNYNRHWVVGAVNADFFNADGSPINIQVEQGELVRLDNASTPALGFTQLLNMYMGKPATLVRALYKGANIAVNAVNFARQANQVNVYNRFAGLSTGTDSAGTEIILRNLTPWYMNDTVVCAVDSIVQNKGNTVIPPGKLILSAGGTAAAPFTNTQKGDTINISFNAFSGLRKINEMIGAHPIIVKNGVVAPLDSSDSFVLTRHPRTGVGFNADTSVMYLITVDGRQTISKGVDLFEFARFMLKLGIYQGINFDGGGSTTMVVRNEIMNSPSDPTGERWVANALLVVSTAPQSSIARIYLSPQNSRLFIGSTLQFFVNAVDSFFNPIPALPNPVQFTLSKPSLGTITPTGGLFTAGSIADTGYVYASYGTIRDSAKIIVKPMGYITVVPEYTVTDHRKLVPFVLKAFDTDSLEVPVQTNLVRWVCTDTMVGSIDQLGQFQGYQNGLTRVITTYSGLSDTSTVEVEIGTGRKIIDSLESKTGWGLMGQNYDSTVTSFSLNTQYHSLGAASFQLDYKFTYINNMYNWIFFQKPVRIYGIPDTIALDIRTDIAGHRLFFDCTDALGQNVRITCNKVTTAPNTWATFPALFPITSTIVYPLTLKSITYALGSGRVNGQTYQGAFQFDNLRIVYPTETPVKIDTPGSEGVLDFKLLPNYPNPFNPVTTITYQTPSVRSPGAGTARGQGWSLVSLKVYDILGRPVATLVDEVRAPGTYNVQFDASALASGAYFYELRANEVRTARKMLLLK